MALRHCFYLVRKFVNFFYVCDYCFFRFFHFSPYNQKDLADLYCYRSTRSILCLGNYSVGWAFCPLTGYFTLPVDKHVTGQLQISFLRAKILSFYIQMKSPFHPEIHAVYPLKTRAFLHSIPYFTPKHQKKTLRTSDHSKVPRAFLF